MGDGRGERRRVEEGERGGEAKHGGAVEGSSGGEEQTAPVCLDRAGVKGVGECTAEGVSRLARRLFFLTQSY